MKRQPITPPAPKPAPRLHGSARDCWDVGSVFQVVTVPAVRLTGRKAGTR